MEASERIKELNKRIEELEEEKRKDHHDMANDLHACKMRRLVLEMRIERLRVALESIADGTVSILHVKYVAVEALEAIK